MDRLDQTLAAELTRLAAGKSLVVALSGGLDSTVLLAAAHQWAIAQHRPLRAIHINHQLQTAAAAFEAHCLTVCAERGIPCEVIRVDVHDDGQGPEAAARVARYLALAEHCRDEECVLLGHHADDQIETFLLQLLRGAGLRGLSAMPSSLWKQQKLFIRPLLSLSRAELLHHAEQARLRWVEDPSNTQLDLRRNWVRHQLLPFLMREQAGVDKALLRVVQHCQDGQSIIDQCAEADLESVQRDERVLAVPALLQLPLERQSSALRFWLQGLGIQVPNQQRLHSFLQQLPHARDSTLLEWPGATLRLSRDQIVALGEQAFSAYQSRQWQLATPCLLPEIGSELSFHGEASTAIATEVTVELRCQVSMSEKVLLPGQAQHKTMKNVLQSRAVPVWLRHCWPAIYLQEELLGMPGLFLTKAGEVFCAQHQGKFVFSGKLPQCWQSLQTPDAPVCE